MCLCVQSVCRVNGLYYTDMYLASSSNTLTSLPEPLTSALWCQPLLADGRRSAVCTLWREALTLSGKRPAWQRLSFTLLHQTKISVRIDVFFFPCFRQIRFTQSNECVCLALLASFLRITLGCFGFWQRRCTYCTPLRTRALIRCLKCKYSFFCASLSDLQPMFDTISIVSSPLGAVTTRTQMFTHYSITRTDLTVSHDCLLQTIRVKKWPLAASQRLTLSLCNPSSLALLISTCFSRLYCSCLVLLCSLQLMSLFVLLSLLICFLVVVFFVHPSLFLLCSLFLCLSFCCLSCFWFFLLGSVVVVVSPQPRLTSAARRSPSVHLSLCPSPPSTQPFFLQDPLLAVCLPLQLN